MSGSYEEMMGSDGIGMPGSSMPGSSMPGSAMPGYGGEMSGEMGYGGMPGTSGHDRHVWCGGRCHGDGDEDPRVSAPDKVP